jgi:SAM-dependent methyltransferase
MSCANCAREYDIDHGVIDLAPDGARPRRSVSQRVRESRFYARIYEEVVREDHQVALDRLTLDKASAVLDVPCGTASSTREFAHAVADCEEPAIIVGADLSWASLETARENLRFERLEDAVQLVRVPAHPLPFAAATFDRVHCRGALHLADNIDAVLAEFARVLEVGGICVISTFVTGNSLAQRALKRLAEGPTGFHWFGPYELAGRMAAQGLAVYAEHVRGDALTVAARRV